MQTQRQVISTRHLYSAALQYWRTFHRLTDEQCEVALREFQSGATLVAAAHAARAAA
jgi:hypothetical protein